MSARAAEADPEISTESWTMRDALQTPQFWIIAAAYSRLSDSAASPPIPCRWRI